MKKCIILFCISAKRITLIPVVIPGSPFLR
nr:MAG TPA: hypothetical protein [Caudoviricetes sp.]DAQ18678.1 MAG TPA: hypothetical protein [Caudoviricetes sp.]DAR26142.1 MAG TPA: hypothetical protein [Caudoviricetes sp.]